MPDTSPMAPPIAPKMPALTYCCHFSPMFCQTVSFHVLESSIMEVRTSEMISSDASSTASAPMFPTTPMPRRPSCLADVVIAWVKSLENCLRSSTEPGPASFSKFSCTTFMPSRLSVRLRMFWTKPPPTAPSPMPSALPMPGATRFITPVAMNADNPSDMPWMSASLSACSREPVRSSTSL